jgi:hypothetical protein
MHLAIWILTLLLVGLWTLGAWGLSSLLALDPSWVGQVQPWLAKVPFGGWLESWFPDWLQVAQVMLDALRTGLAWLGGAAPVLVWVVWGGGALMLLLLAGALSLLVALIQRSTPSASPTQVPPTAA